VIWDGVPTQVEAWHRLSRVAVLRMTTVFHTTAEELDESFLASVKAAFKGRAIEIAVTEDDETGYLLRHPANRERLLRAVADVDAGKNVMTPDQSQFQ
jgi:antitoxin YefM